MGRDFLKQKLIRCQQKPRSVEIRPRSYGKFVSPLAGANCGNQL